MNKLHAYATTTDWQGEDIYVGEFDKISEVYAALQGKNYHEYLIYEITDSVQRIIEKGVAP
jgi:hypothetical protein